MIRVVATFLALVLVGCTTPYRPPVSEFGAPKFPGILDTLKGSASGEVDVIAVHGMCTHDETWAKTRIMEIRNAIAGSSESISDVKFATTTLNDGLVAVGQSYRVPQGIVNFTAIVWSPMTTGLKQQLIYDKTATPTDCSSTADCSPVRATLNGNLKDGLLNDCLADALIYQGTSKKVISNAMSQALRQVVSNGSRRSSPIVLITESLGSKVAFDALLSLLENPSDSDTLRPALDRLAVIFMQANQLPILSLADQMAGPVDELRGFGSRTSAPDALQMLLQARDDGLRGAAVSKIFVVAFTDPNDLLSYRLVPSRYNGPGVTIANVLVSNSNTLFGWIERPDAAHTGYGLNPIVTKLIACGQYAIPVNQCSQ